mmetsp:Transcript_16458/g.23408  ORF Transcript_16458/g.23408 Transcript_16458/m.23408 type:complete len:295 (-) Transcript_16458:147-1031(-)|eukprot:CAMPEP_0184869230 /NCGR_PEP_ID=MMETSP0580-20130426/33429_1 /TAXON_ID=1118495 /ORGANISM="Dactyliosolen fragilissimus" /LENGTH=294 /DNA_ID=CAMNT_0027370587 /DNA_START=23 /DNA_END=907 /DNA_ORIENTATION=+
MDQLSSSDLLEERWIETEEGDNDTEDEPMIFDLFQDPDPYETFAFTFHVEDPEEFESIKYHKKSSSKYLKRKIDIKLNGIKTENGQTIKSTGLTLWRASNILCDYLCENPQIVKGKNILELGAGLGLCGILANKIGARKVVMTDGDTDALSGMRQNVNLNTCTSDKDRLPSSNHSLKCHQLRWGQDIGRFKVKILHDNDLECADINQTGVKSESSDYRFDVIMGSDIIYVEEIIEPLFDTVTQLLSHSNDAVFLLAYARRNVKIDFVLQCAENHGLKWKMTSGVEGIYIFSRIL